MNKYLIDLHQDLGNYFTSSRNFLGMPDSDFNLKDVQNRPCDMEGYSQSGTKIIFAASFPLSITQEGVVLTDAKREIEKDLNAYKAVIKYHPKFKLIKTSHDAEEVFNSEDVIGLILHMEGGEALSSREDVEDYFNKGIRSIGLSWDYPNELVRGDRSDKRVTDLGRSVLVEMKKHDMILDLTHLSERSFFEVLELWNGPFMVSHTAVRELYDHRQNLSAGQIEKIIAKGGIVGLSFFKEFYGETASVETVADHLDYLRIGFGSKNLAFGSDYFGFEQGQSVRGLERIEASYKLAENLQSRGWTEEDIENLFWRNAYTFIKQSLPTN